MNEENFSLVFLKLVLRGAGGWVGRVCIYTVNRCGSRNLHDISIPAL